MAGEDRPETPALALEQDLEREPFRFDFYQALRRLECAHRESPRLGLGRRPEQDPLRLSQEPSLAFAPATLASYRPSQEGEPGRLAVFFFGLFGPNGPLPLHLTEYARDRLRNGSDPTLARFLDIFHHRMLTFFYRAWARAQPTANFDRPDEDRFALYVGSLFGLGMESLRNRDALPDLAKLRHAGLLACQTRHADGLLSTLADFFRLPVRLEEFVGQWLELSGDEICRLGESAECASLGRSVTLGSRAWECQQKFRITLGPLTFGTYEEFLPGRDNLRRIDALVQNYLGQEFAWDVRLILRRDQVPGLRLDGRGRLGWTTWLASWPPAEHPQDLILCPAEEKIA